MQTKIEFYKIASKLESKVTKQINKQKIQAPAFFKKDWKFVGKIVDDFNKTFKQAISQ